MAIENTLKSEADSWKNRFNEQKDLLKAKEKEWRDADSTLRRGISRLSFAIGGIDAKLDKLLAQLRDAIRSNESTETVAQLINDIASLVKQLDDAQDTRGDATESPSTLALTILRELEFPLEQRKIAKKLLQRFEASKDDTEDLEKALLETLQNSFSVMAPTSNNSHRGSGLLTQFLSFLQHKPQTNTTTPLSGTPDTSIALARETLGKLITRIEVRDKDTYTVKSLDARLSQAADNAEIALVVDEFAAIVNSARRAETVRESPSDASVPRIQDVLIQFVDELSIPTELLDESARIKEELSGDSSDARFNAAFKSIVNLVINMRKTLIQEKHELEDFLRQLTQRLQEMDQHLGGTQTHQQTWADEGRKLEAVVQTQVDEIKSSVHEASDLEILKSTIQVRLDVLQTHLDDYQNNERQRQLQLTGELDQAKSRLDNVEQEAIQLRAKLKDKHQQAIIDPLTGIFNRLAYEERVAQEAARFKRYKNPAALLVLDVDHFKLINDKFGHKAGDKALKLIAQVLKESLRETDFLARYGGEEFVALVTDTPIEKLNGVTEKLRAAIESCKFHYAGNDVPITISCGYATFRDGDSVDTVFNRADAALYRAKELGRNQCHSADDV